MTAYGRSPWLDRFPKSRVPSFPKQRGHLTPSVVIIGGGLTGCATAHAFAAAGVDVALVEADRIGRGATSLAAGWISDDPGVSFQSVEDANGLRAARRAWQLWRRSSLEMISALRRLAIRCDLEECPSLTLAATPEQNLRLKKEQKSRIDAGLEAAFLTPRVVSAEVALQSTGALRGKGATLDPYRASVGFAAAARERGALMFEKTAVRRIRFTRKYVDVRTSGGTFRSKQVVIATGIPTELFSSLQRHFWFRSTYLALTERVPAKVRQQLGGRRTVVRDSMDPPHIVRWLNGDQLLVVGADRESPPDRQREKLAPHRTGQLMYELSTLYPDISGLMPEYGWDVKYARTSDGLPYIGPHRNFPRHLFAFGDSSHSVTGAYLASRILLRYFLDKVEPADEAFAFTRNVR
jgi:glycine/D-amino acid oxidase-like deaminating enzyme